MARYKSELTDEQWEKIAPSLPEPKTSPRGGPKPNRACFGGFCGFSGGELGRKTCRRGFPHPAPVGYGSGEKKAVKAWRGFLAQLDAQGQLDWSEAFADGGFAPAKKGGRVSGQPSGARARSGWWWSRAKVFL